MSERDRIRWDRRHAQPSLAPARPTLGWLPPAAPSGALALDLACGQGRHTLVLLELGYRVVAADVSRRALDHLRSRIGLPDRVLLVQADADAWPFAGGKFDLVVVVDFFERNILGALKACLRPGGLLLLDTFLGPASKGGCGPRNPRYRLEQGELDRTFSNWQVLRRHTFGGEPARDAILARKP